MPYVREAIITYRPTQVSLPLTRMDSAKACHEVLKKRIGFNLTESVVVLALDSRLRLIGYHEVAKGTVSGVYLDYADLFRYPIIVGSSNIVLAHNHPSGDTEPSKEDEEMTAEAKSLGDRLGICLVDHLIVADEYYYSFREEGRL